MLLLLSQVAPFLLLVVIMVSLIDFNFSLNVSLFFISFISSATAFQVAFKSETVPTYLFLWSNYLIMVLFPYSFSFINTEHFCYSMIIVSMETVMHDCNKSFLVYICQWKPSCFLQCVICIMLFWQLVYYSCCYCMNLLKFL